VGNKRFDECIEALEAEPHSPNYDSEFSRMTKIDSKAHELAKGYGVSVEIIYQSIDVDPAMFFKEIASDPDASDFHYSDVIRDLKLLENALVPEEHKKYGGLGKIMPEFLKNDYAIFNFFGGPKPVPAGGGEPVKRKEVVLKEEMDVFDYIIGGIIKHKKAIAIGAVAALVGLYASNALVNASKEEHGDDTDRGIRQAELGISGAGAGLEGAASLFDGNASAVTATPTPWEFGKYVLEYHTPNGNMIKIRADNVKDIEATVKSIEYGYKFSPVFNLNWTKDITNYDGLTEDMSADGGYTYVNSSAMHEWIEMDGGGIRVVVRQLAEEEGHNYLSLNDPVNNTDKNVGAFGSDAVYWSLKSVNELEAKNFVENFDFSPWEKQIQEQK